MKAILSEARAALAATLVLGLVCCGIYPAVVTFLGQAMFRDRADGSLIRDPSGRIVGSRLIGQAFTADKYFQSRTSAAGNGYDGLSSGGSNLGPTSKKLRDSVASNVADYRAHNGLATNATVPADAATASGSGLDPHISVENARLQSARVAAARGLSAEVVRALVTHHTAPPVLGFLGDPGVNVVTLNLALDQEHPSAPGQAGVPASH